MCGYELSREMSDVFGLACLGVSFQNEPMGLHL